MTDETTQTPVPEPILGTMEQLRNGHWRWKYLNVSIMSNDKNRVLAFAHMTHLQEQGYLHDEAYKESQEKYKWDENCSFQIARTTIPPAIRTTGGDR
jgi:hypothetical protein